MGITISIPEAMGTEPQGATPSSWPNPGLGVDALERVDAPERGVLVEHAFPLDFSTDPGLINIEVWRRKGVTELVLRGELDLGARRYFGTVLAGATQGGAALVVLDLSALTFMDAGSVDLIHRCRAQLRALGRDLEVRSPNPSLLRILDLTGLSADRSLSTGSAGAS